MAEYSIINWIRTDKPMKPNGKYPIYLRTRLRDKEIKVPMEIDIQKERWTDKKKEPKNKTLLTQLNKKHEDLDLHINRALADRQELNMNLVKEFYSVYRSIGLSSVML